MNATAFMSLVHSLENNPGAVKFDGNVADLPDGSSVYCGSVILMIDVGMCKVDLTLPQKVTLRAVLDYCRDRQRLVKIVDEVLS